MQSKTSYFSKTIFLKNLTRFWPIWSAYFLICMVKLPLRLFYALNAQTAELDPSQLEDHLLTQLQNVVDTSLQPFFFFLFSIITAVAVFSYLYQARSCNMLHALPLCRESLFLTNLLSGACFLVIPQMTAFLGSIFVCFLRHMTQVEYLMHWLTLSVGMVLFAFSLAVFTVMITGNIIASPIFYLMINYSFVICRTVLSNLVGMISYGVDSADISFGSFLSPYQHLSSFFPGSLLYFLTENNASDLPRTYFWVAIYFCTGILLFPLSFFLYKKKHLETAGDIITVPFLQPLFRWAIAFIGGVCIAVLGQTFLVGEYFSGINLLLLLFLLIGGSFFLFFFAEMLLQKRFFVFRKKRFLEYAGFLVLSCSFLIAVDCNGFGLETRIPKQEDIQSIFLSGIYPIHVEEIDFPQVLAIHQNLVDSQKELQQYFRKYRENCHTTTLELTYQLKNGRTQKRRYRIPVEDYYLSQDNYAFNLLEALSDRPDYYLRYHFTDAYEAITFVDGNMDLYQDSVYLESLSLNQKQCQEIFKALQRDIAEGNYKIYDYSLNSQYSDQVYFNSLSFTYQVPTGSTYVYYGGTGTVTDDSMVQATSINLTTSCVHTLQALDTLGILDPKKSLITQKDADLLYEEEVPDAAIYH